jgi:hypothetical protein
MAKNMSHWVMSLAVCKGLLWDFVPLLMFSYMLHCPCRHILMCGKKSVIVWFLKMATKRPLIMFLKVFEFFMLDHISHYFETKLNPPQLGFTKPSQWLQGWSLFTTSPNVYSQEQFYSIYFDFRSTFDLLLHSMLLDNRSSYGLSAGCVNWFPIYLTSRFCYFNFSGVLLLLFLHFIVLSGVPPNSVLGPLLYGLYSVSTKSLRGFENCGVQTNWASHMRFAADHSETLEVFFCRQQMA